MKQKQKKKNINEFQFVLSKPPPKTNNKTDKPLDRMTKKIRQKSRNKLPKPGKGTSLLTLEFKEIITAYYEQV